jgi:hypothetical protein
VPGVKPVKLLVKLPVPVPSEVLSSEIVGLCEVLQHTPLDVTGESPESLMVPPPEALVDVMEDIIVVFRVGGFSKLELLSFLPIRVVVYT